MEPSEYLWDSFPELLPLKPSQKGESLGLMLAQDDLTHERLSPSFRDFFSQFSPSFFVLSFSLRHPTRRQGHPCLA